MLIERFAPHIANPPLCAGIAPRPGETVVDETKGHSRIEFTNRFRIVRRCASKRCSIANNALDRLGVMRCNHPASEADISQILAIGIEPRIRQIRFTGENELLSGGGRRLALAR